MPEGNEIHRHSDRHAEMFVGHTVSVDAPNGRFEDGAKLLNRRKLRSVESLRQASLLRLRAKIGSFISTLAFMGNFVRANYRSRKLGVRCASVFQMHVTGLSYVALQTARSSISKPVISCLLASGLIRCVRTHDQRLQ